MNEDIRQIHSENGELIGKASFRGGKLDGLTKLWSQSGQLTQQATYSDGELHGIYESWWDNGNLKEKGQYHHGNKVGNYQWFDIDGSLIQEHEYWGRHLTNRSSSFRACGPPPDPKRLRPFGPLNSNVIYLRLCVVLNSGTIPKWSESIRER